MPDNLRVLTCTDCGAEWFDAAAAREFDKEMEKAHGR